MQNHFVYKASVQKCKHQNKQNCNYVYCFVWVRSLISHNVRETKAEGVRG